MLILSTRCTCPNYDILKFPTGFLPYLNLFGNLHSGYRQFKHLAKSALLRNTHTHPDAGLTAALNSNELS